MVGYVKCSLGDNSLREDSVENDDEDLDGLEIDGYPIPGRVLGPNPTRTEWKLKRWLGYKPANRITRRYEAVLHARIHVLPHAGAQARKVLTQAGRRK